MTQQIWPLDRRQIARLLHSHLCAHLGESMDFSTFLDDHGEPLFNTPLGPGGYPLDSISLLSLVSRISRGFHLHELGCEDHFLRKRTLGDWCDLLLESWATHLSAVTFFTSGSTGDAKPMTHCRDSLRQETEELGRIFQESRRIIAMVPAHHIYGFLFTILLPSALQVPVVEGRILGPNALAQTLQDGDLVISHPYQWKFLSQLMPPIEAAVCGVTSTAPCPPETFAAVKAKGFQRLVEVYGSSETGGLGRREDTQSPFTLFSYWQPADTSDDPLLIRNLPDGSVLRLPSPDRLTWASPRSFHIQGRRDGAVQVAGHNVYPAAIARIIEEHPDVQHCAVRLMNPDKGDRLKAFIVPCDSTQKGLAAKLHQWCAQELRPAERPIHFRMGPQLPAGAMGKAADWSVT